MQSISIYRLRLHWIKRLGSPILIWNMGKVASTSIARSLWKPLGRHNVLTTHFMNSPAHPRSVAIHQILLKTGSAQLPIITLTREPVGKNVSSFFQNYARNTGQNYGDSQYSVDELCNIFLDHFDKHHTTIDWFDENLAKHIGLDVFSHPFDPERGYSVIEHGRFRVLTLRSEEKDAVKERAIAEFLKLSDFKLQRFNVGSEKNYAETYRKFKRALQLPEDYLQEMLESKYARHFYTPAELSQIKQSWELQKAG